VRHLGPPSALVAVVIATLATAGASPPLPARTAIDFLDRYAGGAFAAVVADLERVTDFTPLLEQLERDGPAWMAAGGEADRERRELAAATFALEAARVDAWNEWKHIVDQPLMVPPPPPAGAAPSKAPPYKPRDVLIWQPPPLLIEWGCRLMSRDPTPRPIERWWQLAALAVAQRSEDFQFLVGNPFDKREFANPQDEIEHLLHVIKRFPDEPRFALAQGIAVEWRWPDEAAGAFVSLAGTPAVSGEAAMRLGRLQSVSRNSSNQRNAAETLERAERLTRDPYVVYLARYFKGQLHERRGRLEDAERAYRGAVAAVPHAQSATVALSALLYGRQRRAEAEALTSAMFRARPQPVDPWRAYAHADDRFWPQLIARLRREIAR
jgi:hypothetical protein